MRKISLFILLILIITPVFSYHFDNLKVKLGTGYSAINNERINDNLALDFFVGGSYKSSINERFNFSPEMTLCFKKYNFDGNQK